MLSVSASSDLEQSCKSRMAQIRLEISETADLQPILIDLGEVFSSCCSFGCANWLASYPSYHSRLPARWEQITVSWLVMDQNGRTLDTHAPAHICRQAEISFRTQARWSRLTVADAIRWKCAVYFRHDTLDGTGSPAPQKSSLPIAVD